MQHHILNNRAFFGLPRKFNIAFDGGGRVARAGGDQRHRLHRLPRAARAGGPARRLVPPGAGRHHRPSRPRPRRGRARRARGVHAGRRRDRARVHRRGRPHRPQEGAAEVRARPLGPRRVPGRGRELGWAYRCRACRWTTCEPRGADRPHGASRRPPAAAGRPVLPRRVAAGRPADRPRRCASSPPRRASYGDGESAADRLAEPAALRRAREPTSQLVKERLEAGGLDWRPHAVRAGLVACTGAIGCKFGLAHTKETARGDRRAPGGAARARPAGQHPPHRLPELLRPALYRRHRPARRQGPSAARTTVEGFRLFVGGGWGDDARIGRELSAASPCRGACRPRSSGCCAPGSTAAPAGERLRRLHQPPRDRDLRAPFGLADGRAHETC